LFETPGTLYPTTLDHMQEEKNNSLGVLGLLLEFVYRLNLLGAPYLKKLVVFWKRCGFSKVGKRKEAEAAESKAWVCGRSVVGIVRSNPAGAWVYVSHECCALSGRGLSNGRSTFQKSPTECVCVAECNGVCLVYKKRVCCLLAVG
jgi:hypothetical protein